MIRIKIHFYEAAKIRKKNINNIRKKLRKFQDPIDRAVVVKYLIIGKNKQKVSEEDMERHVKQDEEFYDSTAEKYLLMELLRRLEEVDKKLLKRRNNRQKKHGNPKKKRFPCC